LISSIIVHISVEVPRLRTILTKNHRRLGKICRTQTLISCIAYACNWIGIPSLTGGLGRALTAEVLRGSPVLDCSVRRETRHFGSFRLVIDELSDISVVRLSVFKLLHSFIL
jgi:hypothetical protein